MCEVIDRAAAAAGPMRAELSRSGAIGFTLGDNSNVTGHEHFNERFAPQTPASEPAPAFGIRQLIVGTGGARFHRAGARAPNSEMVIDDTL